jgi:hypothetical protein
MYDRSEAAVRRIVARARENGEVGKLYVHLAMMLMKSTPSSPLRDRALKRLADSCDDAMPMLEKVEQTPGLSVPNPSSRRQTGR